MANILSQTTNGSTMFLVVSSDPSAGSGTTAPIGSIATAVDGTGVYIKKSASNTDWKSNTSLPATTKTSTYEITASDYVVRCNGTFTTTLPTAVGRADKIYIIKNIGSGVVTLATTSSQTIDGVTTQTVLSGNWIMVQSDGSNWVVIG